MQTEPYDFMINFCIIYNTIVAIYTWSTLIKNFKILATD